MLFVDERYYTDFQDFYLTDSFYHTQVVAERHDEFVFSQPTDLLHMRLFLVANFYSWVLNGYF